MHVQADVELRAVASLNTSLFANQRQAGSKSMGSSMKG